MKKGVLHKIGLKKTGGRNNTGRITVRHRGGGHKRAYRATNYQTISENGKIHNHYISGTINNISYDPNRSAYLALCKNDDKVFNLIFGGTNLGAQKGGAHQAHVATRPESYKGLTQHVSKIKDISVGDLVYNLSLLPGKSGQFSRASGTFCKILKQDEKLTVVRLPSYAVKAFNNNNFCILGAVRRPSRLAPFRKAGRNRWLGIRPTVRGVAMNPIDHPNGGKTKGGGQSKNLWGNLAKWVKTSVNTSLKHF